MHHLVGDGRSVEIVLRDMVAFYRGSGDSLPPLPLRFADLAARHRDRLDQGRAQAAIEHWTKRLDGAPPLDLPTDLPGDAPSPPPGLTFTTPIDRQTIERVQALAAAEGTTPNVIGISAFAVFLARVTGSRDTCLRTPVSYREDAAAHDVVGDFSNDFVLRVDLTGASRWRDVIDTVRRTLTSDLGFHDLPPHLLAPHVAPGLLDQLFQVQFTTEREIDPPALGPGVTARTWTPPFPYAYRALSVRLRLGVHPHFVWICRGDLFSPERARELARANHDVLLAVVDDPDEPAPLR